MPAEAYSHQLHMLVDPGLTLEDRDRSNNAASVWAVLPNLAVETCRSEAISASEVALTVRVANTGVVSAGAFDVAWRLGTVDGPEVGRMTLDGLAPGAAREGTLLWGFGGRAFEGSFATVFAVVDPDDLAQEQAESDNVYPQSVRVEGPPDPGSYWSVK